jgi:hypothetical protein
MHALETLAAEQAQVATLPFAAEPAWQGRLLSSWVGGWTFVHLPPALDTGQAADAPSAEPLPQPELVEGHVESFPLLYARLAAVTLQARTGLEERKMLGDEMAEKLARYERLLQDLVAATTRQAANPKAASPEDTVLFQTFSERLQKVVRFADGRASPPMIALATVYANPNTGYELKMGLGEGWQLYAIVPVAGRPTLAIGLVFSMYQFREPVAQGWDPDIWSAALERPEAAPWMRAYWTPEAERSDN